MYARFVSNDSSAEVAGQNIPTCTPQSEVGSIASDFALTVDLGDYDNTLITYTTETEGATDITFPAVVPGLDGRIWGDVSLRFTVRSHTFVLATHLTMHVQTKKKASHVNDLLNTYGVVFAHVE